MTDLTQGQIDLRRQFRNVAYRSSLQPLTGGATPRAAPTHIGQDFLHLLGKPEEIVSKTLGQIFSDDPKYDDIFGSSTYWSQIGFFENIKDMGVNEDNFGAFGPFLAAVLGLGAALANPLDPLNKVKFLQATKKGVVAERVGGALAHDAVKFLRDQKKYAHLNEGRGLAQIDDAVLKKTLQEKKEMLSSLDDLQLPGLDVQGTRSNLNASIRDLQRSLEENKNVNNLLRHMQETAGLSLDQIKLGDSVGDQIRLGQKHLVGFSSVKKFDQLSFAGIHGDDLSEASSLNAGLLLGLPTKKAQAAFADVVGKMGAGAWAGIRGLASTVSGGRIAGHSGKMRDAIQNAQSIVNAAEGNKKMMEDNLLNLHRSLDLTRDQMYEVIDALESPNEIKRMAQHIVDQLPQVQDFESFKTATRIKEVPEDDPLFGNMVPGSRLTRDQTIATTPSGLDPINDLPQVQRLVDSGNLPGRPIGPENQQSTLYNLPDHVVIKLHPRQDAADFAALNNIYGIRAYAQVDPDMLVMKKMPAVGQITETNPFTETHLHNLIGIAKELGLRGKAFSHLTLDDLMVNAVGGVQVVNPSKIVTVKQGAKKAAHQKQAMGLSRTAIDTFVDSDTLIPRGAGRDYTPLASAAAARRAPLHAAYRGDRKVGLGQRANIDDLLLEAVNASPERDFMRGLIAGEQADQAALLEYARSNGIEREYLLNFDRLQRGLPLHFDPVTVTFDSNGQLFIREGFERAVAAKMLGADYIPIKVKTDLGEVPAARGYYTGPSHKILDVARDQGTNGLENLQGPFQGMGSPDYRLVQNGEYVPIRQDIHAQGAEQGAELLAASAELARVGLAGGTQAADARKSLLVQAILGNVGRSDDGRFLPRGQAQANAYLLLATAAEEAESYEDFVQALRRMTQNQKTRRMMNLDNVNADHVEAADIFERVIKPRAKLYLDSLAEGGYLREIDLSNPARMAKAMEALGGAEILVARPHNLEIHSIRRQTADLTQVANRFLNQTVDAADIEPLGRITLRGTDGVAFREVKDFVNNPHPRLSQTVLPGSRFQIGDAELTEWRRVHGIVKVSDNMTDEEKGLLGLKAGGRIVRSDNRTLPFFITRDGELFVSGRYNTVDDLLKGAFGERGPFHAVETGIMTSDGLVVDGLLGTQRMEKMGKAEVRALKNRMQVVAKKLKEMGVADQTKIRFNMPFDEAVWEQVYGKDIPIAKVVKPSFRLKVPDMVLDMPLDNRLRVSTAKRPRFKDTRQQHLFEFLEKNYDELGIEEWKRGLVNSWHEAYFNRLPTDEAREALNKVFTELKANKLPGQLRTLKAMESFLKQRLFTDLTTRDVNNLFETVKKHVSGTWDSPEEMLASLMKQLEEDYKVTLSPAKLRQYMLIAEAMPEGATFFITDPIRAFNYRNIQSQNLQKTQDIVKTMVDAGAAMEVSAQDFKALQKARGTRGLLAETRNAWDAKREELSDAVRRLTEDPGNESLVEEVSKLQQEADELGLKHYRNEEEVVNKYGAMALDYDDKSGVLHISGVDAQRLLRENKLSPEDLQAGQGFDDSLVAIPVERFVNEIEAGNMRVVLFTEEGKRALDRFFAVKGKTGFDKFLGYHDRLLNIFRMNVLFPIPAFHGRNMLSIAWQGWLGDISVQSFQESMRVMKVLAQKQRGIISLDEAARLLDTTTLSSSTGQVISARELLEEFHRRGGFLTPSSNEYTNFGKNVRLSEFERETRRLGGLSSVSEQSGSIFDDNILVRTGLKFSNFYESRARMAAFIHEYKKSGDINKAERFMKEIFYDYTNLNAFERGTMRRVVPFYNWYRHNIPRMLKTLVTDPVKHVRFLRFLHQIEQGATSRVPPNERDFPEWFRENFGFIVFKGKDGKYFVKSGEGLFPMVDVYKILSGGVSGAYKTGINAVTPLFKFPVEQLTNTSLFTGRQIAGADNLSRDFAFSRLGFTRRADPTGPLLVGNLILNDSFIRNFFRLGSEASLWLSDLLDEKRWLNGEPAMSVALWDFILGRGSSIDPETTRNIQMMNLRRDKGSLRYALKYYTDQGNDWYANEIRRKLLQLDLQFGADQ